jgi:RES domain
MDISDLTNVNIDEQTHRLIPSMYPPIDLLERVASPEEFEILYEIESLTNTRLRDEVGDIALIAKNDRIAGPGTSYIMAAFTHINVGGEGGRFHDGFGVYYAARELKTAIEETKYHRAKFFKDFTSPPTKIGMRQLVADLQQCVFTIAHRQQELLDIYQPDSYQAGQRLARQLKKRDAWAIQYSSVRTDGICYAVFRPPALSNARQSKHYEYHFDGDKISHVVELRTLL